MGLSGEPIAELTKFVWVIVFPGQETRVTNMLFFKTSLHDYEKLFSLDFLGIEEKRDDSNHVSLLLLLFSLLFTIEKGFSKSYLHITT